MIYNSVINIASKLVQIKKYYSNKPVCKIAKNLA